MFIYGLRVQQTTFPVAAAERRGRAPRVLGVAAASTSTVVFLCGLCGAAGAHPADAAGRGCPGAPRGCRDGCTAAGATGSAATRGRRSAALLPHLREFSAGRKRRGILAPVTAD